MPRRRRRVTDPDARIAFRVAAARRALETAIKDMKRAVGRVCRLQARVQRLEVAQSTPAEERRARAARALETRQAVPAHRRRALRVREEG